MNKKNLYRAISVVFAILVWQIVALLVNADFLLATPINVIIRTCTLLFEENFVKIVLFSFLRISCGFIFAFVLGIIMAVIAGKYSFFEYLFWPLIIVAKAVPIASFIILFLIWVSFNELTVFVAFLIVLPVVYLNVLQGIKNADKKLIEVSNLYKVPFFRKLIYIYIPSIKPFLISASNVGIGMAYKAGVAAEVIGVIRGSIGEKLYDAKIYFQNADLLSWTIIIIFLSTLSEKLFVKLIKKIFSWIEKI